MPCSCFFSAWGLGKWSRAGSVAVENAWVKCKRNIENSLTWSLASGFHCVRAYFANRLLSKAASNCNYNPITGLNDPKWAAVANPALLVQTMRDRSATFTALVLGLHCRHVQVWCICTNFYGDIHNCLKYTFDIIVVYMDTSEFV